MIVVASNPTPAAVVDRENGVVARALHRKNDALAARHGESEDRVRGVVPVTANIAIIVGHATRTTRPTGPSRRGITGKAGRETVFVSGHRSRSRQGRPGRAEASVVVARVRAVMERRVREIQNDRDRGIPEARIAPSTGCTSGTSVEVATETPAGCGGPERLRLTLRPVHAVVTAQTVHGVLRVASTAR